MIIALVKMWYISIQDTNNKIDTFTSYILE